MRFCSRLRVKEMTLDGQIKDFELLDISLVSDDHKFGFCSGPESIQTGTRR